MTLFRSFRALPVVVGVAACLSACSGGDKSAQAGGAKSPNPVRVETIKHEPCEESGHRVELLDSNNDNKPDIKRMYDKGSGVEVCRVIDLNHDGRADLYEYFDSSGATRRREYAYDDSGAVNAIEYYEGGKLVRREYDTTGQHRIDTWDYFDPAKPPNPKTGRPVPVRRERDTNGDGKIDQWWVWDGEKITITVDRTGDGRPDPENTIVLNDNDAGAPPLQLPGDTSSSDGGASAPVATAPTSSAPAPSAAKDGGKP